MAKRQKTLGSMLRDEMDPEVQRKKHKKVVADARKAMEKKIARMERREG